MVEHQLKPVTAQCRACIDAAQRYLCADASIRPWAREHGVEVFHRWQGVEVLGRIRPSGEPFDMGLPRDRGSYLLYIGVAVADLGFALAIEKKPIRQVRHADTL